MRYILRKGGVFLSLLLFFKTIQAEPITPPHPFRDHGLFETVKPDAGLDALIYTFVDFKSVVKEKDIYIEGYSGKPSDLYSLLHEGELRDVYLELYKEFSKLFFIQDNDFIVFIYRMYDFDSYFRLIEPFLILDTVHKVENILQIPLTSQKIVFDYINKNYEHTFNFFTDYMDNIKTIQSQFPEDFSEFYLFSNPLLKNFPPNLLPPIPSNIAPKKNSGFNSKFHRYFFKFKGNLKEKENIFNEIPWAYQIQALLFSIHKTENLLLLRSIPQASLEDWVQTFPPFKFMEHYINFIDFLRKEKKNKQALYSHYFLMAQLLFGFKSIAEKIPTHYLDGSLTLKEFDELLPFWEEYRDAFSSSILNFDRRYAALMPTETMIKYFKTHLHPFLFKYITYKKLEDITNTLGNDRSLKHTLEKETLAFLKLFMDYEYQKLNP